MRTTPVTSGSKPPAATPSPRSTRQSIPAGPARFAAHGPRDAPSVALTFHASGNAGLVASLLDSARSAAVPLTFFAVGQWLEGNQGLGRRMLAEGHELDNHTYTHPVLGQEPAQAVAEEIRRCKAALERLEHTGGGYFRPSGMTTPTQLVLGQAGLAGYPLVVGFDVDPADYADPGSATIVRRVAAAVGPGSIVSLHTGHAGTVAAFGPIMGLLQGRGLRPVLVRELLAGLPSASPTTG